MRKVRICFGFFFGWIELLKKKAVHRLGSKFMLKLTMK